MNNSQVVMGKTKSEFRQIYLAYPDILIEAWHPLVSDSRDFILKKFYDEHYRHMTLTCL